VADTSYSQPSKRPWKPTQARLKALRATEWPSSPPVPSQDSTQSPEANLVLWDKATRAQRMLENGPFGQDQQALREHFMLLAVRFTRLLAMASRTIAPHEPLSTVPSRPDGWSAPLSTLPESSFHIPVGLTLSPHSFPSPEVWADTLMSCSHLLTHTPAGPSHFLIQYLAESPESLASFWPDPKKLCTFEQELLELVSDRLARQGRQRAYDFLTARMDFTFHEANHFLAMAAAPFREYARLDQDTARGLLMARTEDFTRRAKKALDLKAEYNGLKLQANILGLTRGESRNEEDDKNTDFREVVARVTSADGPPKFRLPDTNEGVSKIPEEEDNGEPD
jgi:hypothetical protein